MHTRPGERMQSKAFSFIGRGGANMAALATAQAMPAILRADAMEQYIAFIDRPGNTARAYIINLRQFAAWMAYKAIKQPQRADIMAFRSWLQCEHEAIELANNEQGWSYRTNNKGSRYTITCKASTVAQYLRSLCAFFRWTATEGIYPNIAENIHAPKIRADRHKKEALTAEQVATIEQSIQERATARAEALENSEKDTAGKLARNTEQEKRLYAMYLLAVNAGLRTIELARANVKDIEVKNGQAYIYIWGKGHSEADQRKPLAAEVLEAINDYLQTRESGCNKNMPLFVSTGNRAKGKRIATTTISTMLKNAMVQAGYNSDRLTAHSLRHTAGTAAMHLTGDIYTVQQYMRHASPATTEIYLHNDTEEQESGIATRLYNYYHDGADTHKQTEQRILGLMQRMTAEQLEQLESIATMICK